ncbi:hypothetical protein [Pluralibacter gergoviae]
MTMKNDITELAQREKFEAWAEHACAAPWGYLKKRRTTEGYFEQIYTCMWTAWKAAGAELVEALDKAQAKATQQGNIAGALFDEVTQLRRHADEKAPELRAQLIEADSELEALRQRIAELESKLATPVQLPKTNGYWTETEKAYEEAITLAKRQIRLAGFRCEGDE